MISSSLFLQRNRYIHQASGGLSYISRGLTLMLILTLLCGCKQVVSIDQETLYGQWDIVKAERNGKETPYLRGGYFIIEKSGSMTVNITGSDEKGPFILQTNVLHADNNKDFIIESLMADSMMIRYVMDPGTTFLIYLHKQHDEPQ
jgi:hypothetical protein